MKRALLFFLFRTALFAFPLYYTTVTIDHTQIPSSQTGYPMVFRTPQGTVTTAATAVSWVSGDTFQPWMQGNPILINGVAYTVLTYTSTTALVLSSSAGTQTGVAYFGTPNFRSVSNGGYVADNTNGYDLIPFTDNTCLTRLHFEREAWDPTTGAVVFWTNQNPSHTADVPYTFCYDDSTITTDQSDPTNVWDANYVYVSHLKTVGGALDVSDSTGINSPVNHSATATPGQIDGSANFVSASSQYIDGGNNAVLDITTAVTLEAWIIAPSSGGIKLIVGNYTGAPSNGYEMWYYTNSTGQSFCVNKAGSENCTNFNAFPEPAGTVHYYAATYDGSKGIMNPDASNPTGANGFTASNALGSSSQNLNIGRLNGAVQYYWDGWIDEVRISNIARSPDWITITYASQKTSSTLQSLSLQGNVAPPAHPRRKILNQ
jgi:hypothetical protein